MNTAKQKKNILLIISILTIVSSLFAEVISDKTEHFIEKKPLDFEASGEDIAYDAWMKKYSAEEKRHQQEIDKFTNDYVKNLKHQLKVNKSGVGAWRDSQYAAISHNTALFYKAKMIAGTKTASGIQYRSNNVKAGGIHLGRIASVRAQGDIVGMFSSGNKLYAVVDDGQASNEDKQDLRYSSDIPVLIKGFFESPHNNVWLTIDPPQDRINQNKYGIVRYGGSIANTHVGSVLFESDRLMKCLSIGFDNRSGDPISLSWFKSEWDFMTEVSVNKKQYEQEEWHRFWFTTEDARIAYDSKNKAVRILGKYLTVKTERMEMVKGKLRSTFEPRHDTPPQKWTEHFNQNLDRYAKDYPVLIKLKELSRWAALIMAMRETGIFFNDVNLSTVNLKKTSVKTPVISAIKKRWVNIEELKKSSKVLYTKIGSRTIIGGVGFQKIAAVKDNLGNDKRDWIKGYNNGSLRIERIF